VRIISCSHAALREIISSLIGMKCARPAPPPRVAASSASVSSVSAGAAPPAAEGDTNRYSTDRRHAHGQRLPAHGLYRNGMARRIACCPLLVAHCLLPIACCPLGRCASAGEGSSDAGACRRGGAGCPRSRRLTATDHKRERRWQSSLSDLPLPGETMSPDTIPAARCRASVKE
jgi:hypothetical protein